MAENEYIRKAQVKRAFGRLLNDERSANEIFQSGFEYGVNLAWLKIENMHAADVAPVVHGHWDDSLDGITPFCSACGKSHRVLTRTPNYCPNCGAKMDGKEQE